MLLTARQRRGRLDAGYAHRQEDEGITEDELDTREAAFEEALPSDLKIGTML